MLSFLHSADWQIGKPFARVQDPDKRALLRQARINCIDRIGAVAQSQAASLLLVAGDLFDSPTPSSSDISAVCQAIGRLPLPVLVIPGNHDHGAPGSVWHQPFFKAEQQRRAPNLQVLLEREPLVLEEAIVLPCPLLRRHESEDPTAWIRNLAWSDLPSDRPRILLAHGSVHGFGADDLDADEENPSSDRNRLRLDPALLDAVDYVALGDWHGLKQIQAKAWYSGTPEPDRFPRSEDYQGEQVLAVRVNRGGLPQVSAERTGALHWLHHRVELHSEEDLGRLERSLEQQLGDEPGQHLLLLEESGRLSFQAHRRYALLLERLEAQLLRLKRRGRCEEAPDALELDQLTSRADDPLIATVASRLQGDLSNPELPAQERALLQQALAELHRCVGA
ncbi:MAG: metallophosphoesterase family protein [Vulcanococcus sp.]